MSEIWNPRGIGKEWNLPCFVTGQQPHTDFDLKDNIAGFVKGREAGERVVALFNGLARLDYRASEPNRVQVKIGVMPEYLPALEKLYALVRDNDNVITPEIIAEAKRTAPRPQ